MKNLQSFGVQELSAKEIKETDGGGSFVKLVGRLFGRMTEYYYRGGQSNRTWG
jgi:hypothetical protein